MPPTTDSDAGMDVDIVDKSQATNMTIGSHGSNLGWAPVPEEASPQVVQRDEAIRHLANPKPERFGKLAELWTIDEKEQVKEADDEIQNMASRLGGNVENYVVEREGVVNRVLTEIYSAPRVTSAAKLLPSLKIIPGMAFDLTTADSDGTPWDFDDPIKRKRAWKIITTEKPAVVVGSPMCRHWSAWQNINHMHKRAPARPQGIHGAAVPF